MNRWMFIPVLMLTLMMACKTRPAKRTQRPPLLRVSQPKTCETGFLADCVERGNEFLAKDKILIAERYFQRACGRGEAAGCMGIAEISLKRQTPDHRRRAKFYLRRACSNDYYEACDRLGSTRTLDIPPTTRESYLNQACMGGLPASCAKLAERKDKYRGKVYEAQKFYRLACEGGLTEYCQRGREKRAPTPRSGNREVFLRSLPSDKRTGSQFSISAGPCTVEGCPFHVYLKNSDGILAKQKLPWSSTAGPVERASRSSLGAGYENHFVGTYLKRVRLGPHMDGVEVMQEKGYEQVQHRSDIYLQLENDMVQIPWTENGKRSSKPAPNLLAVVIGLYDGQKQAMQAYRELSGKPCGKDVIVFSTNYFPKQKSGKWILGALKLGQESAFATLERWAGCFENTQPEVHRLYR